MTSENNSPDGKKPAAKRTAARKPRAKKLGGQSADAQGASNQVHPQKKSTVGRWELVAPNEIRFITEDIPEGK